MPERISRELLDNLFARYCLVAEQAGYDPTGWTLSYGSATMGVSFTSTTPGHRSYTAGTDASNLGTTKATAYATLRVIIRTLEDLAHDGRFNR